MLIHENTKNASVHWRIEKGVFDFEVCCRLITPGETKIITESFSWFDNKHLLSIYLFDRIFYFILTEIGAPRGIPFGSPSNTLLIKSDTVPCSDTAEVADSWDWSLWGMVALTTWVRLTLEDWESLAISVAVLSCMCKAALTCYWRIISAANSW